MTAKRKKAPNFEKSLNELEAIVETLEEEELPLEEALKHFEKGVKLTRDCQTALSSAEQQVKILLASNELEDFDADEE